MVSIKDTLIQGMALFGFVYQIILNLIIKFCRKATILKTSNLVYFNDLLFSLPEALRAAS